jgi:hypothetical protein
VYKLDNEGVKHWMRLIQLSIEWKRPYVEKWNRVIDYLKGQYFEPSESGDEVDQICVNMVRPHVNVVVPAVYSRNPDVLVTPRRLDQAADEVIIKRAEIMQNLLRYYLEELDIKTEAKLCILDAILTGHGWMKTGYETEIEVIEEGSKEKKETLISMFLKSVGVKEFDEEKEPYRPNEKVVSERVWSLRVSPFDIIVPALSRRTEEMQWIVERFIYPHDYVMAQADWDTEGLKPSANANELLASLRGSKYKSFEFGKEIGYNVIYEVWDGVNQCKQFYETLIAPQWKRRRCDLRLYYA